MSSPVVVLDACVLYPAQVRSLFMYLAGAGLFQPRWTDAIHEEWIRNLLDDHSDITRPEAERILALMNAHVPDCLVTGYEGVIPTLDLPDPDDRHVLAAAIQGGATAVVTFNLTDFPQEKLTPHTVEPVHPDEFVLGLVEESPERVARVLKKQAGALRSPPRTPRGLVELLAETLPRSMAAIQEQTPV